MTGLRGPVFIILAALRPRPAPFYRGGHAQGGQIDFQRV